MVTQARVERFPRIGLRILLCAQCGTSKHLVPSALVRAGVIRLPNAAGCCDLRGAGLNPVVTQIWSKFMPVSNGLTAGDHKRIPAAISSEETGDEKAGGAQWFLVSCFPLLLGRPVCKRKRYEKPAC